MNKRILYINDMLRKRDNLNLNDLDKTSLILA